MTNLPFQLSIKINHPDKGEKIITCTKLLREIPHKRQVYEASWNGNEVIIKIFLANLFSKCHMEREWKGLKLLSVKKMNSPKPLFYGKTDNNHWVLAIEKIRNATTVLQAFEQAGNGPEKVELLGLVCEELAKLNKNGIIQKDLHLGNFLIADGKIFALDCSQMDFHAKEISKKESIAQLAFLPLYLGDDEKKYTKNLCDKYAAIRGWQFDKPDEVLLEKQMDKTHKEAVVKGLKKYLRSNKKHIRIERNGYKAIFDRSFIQDFEPIDFIRQLDVLMDNGQILKNGNSCYVSRVKWNNHDVVVKRYNHKDIIHSLRHTIKKSRGYWTWQNSHRLGMLRIATAEPLVYIEQYKWPLLWRSYILTEYIEGQKLYDFLRDTNVTEQARDEILHKTKKLISKLHQNLISHGDLKHSNIIISGNQPYLIDLDGMKVDKLQFLHKIRSNKDTACLKNIT